MTEEQLEKERHIDDDYECCSITSIVLSVGTQIFHSISKMKNGDTYEFGWKLIYQYIENLNA